MYVHIFQRFFIGAHKFNFQSAKVSEVRKAYRKLSLVLHPDKSDSPDAEIKFRQVCYLYSAAH